MFNRNLLVFFALFLMFHLFVSKSELLNPHGEKPAEIVKQVMEKYGIEQGDLELVDSGFWKFESETSAVVAFETSERAMSMLEWGESNSYGNQINNSEQHYIHIFYLKNLSANQTYHLKITAYNPEHTKEIESDDIIINTKSIPNAIRVPDDFGGNPPYILDQSNAYYLVTEDIDADSTAIIFTGEGSTLDLGGHTIIYNEIPLRLPTEEWTPQRNNSSFGIKMQSAGPNMKVFNGRIMQGQGNDTSSYVSLGFNPIYISGGEGFELAGVDIQYSGVQITGVYCHWSGENYHIHHNIVTDSGKYIINRHQQVTAIKMNSPGGGLLYNNLIKRARQTGLALGTKSKAYHNEIHIDSYSINSFGIGAKDTSKVYANKIFGCGDNTCAIATTGGTTDTEVFDNYIWLQAHSLDDYKPFLNPKEMEATDVSTMSAIRVTWGGLRINYHNNIILVTGREGGILRGSWLYSDNNTKDIKCENNLIIALAEDDSTKGWGAIGGVGNHSHSDAPPITFNNNTVVSNFINYSMKDTYGYSMNYLFTNNTFVKVGDRADYTTINSHEGYSSKGAVFIDTKFEGGAGFNNIYMSNYSEDEFTVKWTLLINSPQGTEIRIKDKDDNDVVNTVIDESRQFKTVLTEFKQVQDNRLYSSPYAIIAHYQEREKDLDIDMNASKTITLFEETKVENDDQQDLIGIVNNRFNKELIIRFKNNVGTKIKIYNLFGQMIEEIPVRSGSVITEYNWNYYYLPSGIYFINYGNGVANRIIKVIL